MAEGISQLSIRDAEEAEWQEVVHLVSAAFLRSPVFAGIDEARYAPEAVLKLASRGRILVATIEEEIVGSVTLFGPDPMSLCPVFRKAPHFGLLAVLPEAAARGIASALLDYVELQVTSEIALSVTKRGEELVSRYQRRGYVIEQDFTWPGARDGSWIMRKSFS